LVPSCWSAAREADDVPDDHAQNIGVEIPEHVIDIISDETPRTVNSSFLDTGAARGVRLRSG
jgi:hypothetical protein